MSSVQGVLVNFLNPKTALFFLAFLPQLVDVTTGAVATRVLFFGILLVLMGLVSDGLYALMAGGAGEWLKGNSRFLRAQRFSQEARSSPWPSLQRFPAHTRANERMRGSPTALDAAQANSA